MIISNEIKDLICKYVSLHNEFTNFDFSCINRICTFKEKNLGYIGKVNPINNNGKLEFEILYHASILNNISQNESVILHEFFHCKEMLSTSKHIDWQRIYFTNNHSQTYGIILEFGYFQFSEFYAYYKTCKYKERAIDLSKLIHEVDIYLSLMSNEENEVILFNEAKEAIENFARELTILAAQYRYSKNPIYMQEIESYNNERYKKIYTYIKRILPWLYDFYAQYPSNISESKLLEYGKVLYSIIHQYKLNFSTEDLSDNFILTVNKDSN